MAKLLTPLHAFSASGTLAKTVVFYSWKGIQCARAYIIPPDPKTPAQLQQRDRMRRAVATATDFPFSRQVYDSWNLAVCTLTLRMTGRNATVKEFMSQQDAPGVQPFVSAVEETAPNTIRATLIDIKTLAPSAPGTMFIIFWGSTPYELTNLSFATQTLTGELNLTPFPPDVVPVFFQIFEATQMSPRSGIIVSPEFI